MNDLISLNEAANLIGKNLRTIQRYIKTGKLTRFDKDGKTYVDKKEVEGKIGIVAEKKQEDKPSSPPKSTASDNKDYQAKWVQEIQSHAQTREELGVWKGRAEAYQAFASRLLGTGENIDVKNIANIKNNVPSEIKKRPFNIYLVYYIAIGILLAILIALIIFTKV